MMLLAATDTLRHAVTPRMHSTRMYTRTPYVTPAFDAAIRHTIPHDIDAAFGYASPALIIIDYAMFIMIYADTPPTFTLQRRTVLRR